MKEPREIYIQLKDGFNGYKGSTVLIKDLATVLADSDIKEGILNIEVLKIQKDAHEHIVVSILTLIEKILKLFPNNKIFPIGDSEVLIKIIEPAKKEKNFIVFFKLALVCMILFVGTGLAVMNFHADVNMGDVHRKLYKLVTGLDEKRPLILQIPYSLGIGLGMTIFFNHILPKKYSNEPSPMEVEMFSYRKNIDGYLLKNEKNTEEDT